MFFTQEKESYMRAERLRREEQKDEEKRRIKKQPPKEEGLTVTNGRSVLEEGKENNEKAALSYEEISLFYKKFLEENHDKHVKYSR